MPTTKTPPRLTAILSAAGVDLPGLLGKIDDEHLDILLRKLAQKNPNYALRLFSATSRLNAALERFFYDPPVYAKRTRTKLVNTFAPTKGDGAASP